MQAIGIAFHPSGSSFQNGTDALCFHYLNLRFIGMRTAYANDIDYFLRRIRYYLHRRSLRKTADGIPESISI